jgi:hypothetical protein
VNISRGMEGYVMEINQAAIRDANGRFAPGNSGNPAGKKPGTRNRATVLREALTEGEDVAAARIVIDKALAGDAVAARFIVDRLTPRSRGRTIALDLPEGKRAGDVLAASNATIAAMAAGEITPDEALTVTKVLDGRLRALKAAAREEEVSPALEGEPSPSGRGQGEGRRNNFNSSNPTFGRHPHPDPLPEGEGMRMRSADFRASLLHSACNFQFAAAPRFLTTGSRAA